MSEVNILGKRYQIEPVTDTGLVDSSRNECCTGMIDHRTRKIRIFVGNRTRKWSIRDQTETLLHELLHALFEADSLLDEYIQHNHRESVTQHLSVLLLDTLDRNGLVNYRMAAELLRERKEEQGGS